MAVDKGFGLAGRVVTMDDGFAVLDSGVVWVDEDGRIVAVQDRDAAAPAELAGAEVTETGGTIYPGLIELHNHLSYNVLRLWQVPQKYTNRDRWAQGDTYRQLVTGPMKVLAHTTEYVRSVVRYVECKCLLGGTTTSQGIALASYSGIAHFYKGVVRNCESPDDPTLHAASSHIADVEATDRDRFLERLKKSSSILLHLSEGTDDKARAHFLALRNDAGEWAIWKSLAGIHCVALKPEDFKALHDGGGAMVWSPLSNLLLYGATADIKAAKDAGLTIGIGPDWSPSGSKNVLGELKVARLVSHEAGDVFEDRELVALATRNAAKILKWDQNLGSIEAGKLADFLVLEGTGGDPYDQLLTASEKDVAGVVIAGVARHGKPDLVRALLGGEDETEEVSVGGAKKLLHLRQPTADPDVGKLTLKQAVDSLSDGLSRLPELAKELDKKPLLAALDAPPGEAPLFLALDHEEHPGVHLRPHFMDESGRDPAMIAPVEAVSTPLPDLLKPLELDAPTLVDDDSFLETLKDEQNLPDYVKEGLGAS